MFDVATRQVAEQRVITIQRALTVDTLPDFIMEATGVLCTHVEASRAKQAGPSFVAYHGLVDNDSDGPVEVCVPFEGTVDPVGEMHVRVEPAHAEAYTTISLAQCSFPGILDAYGAVDRWIGEQGRTVSGSPREVYFVEHTKVGPKDPFCDVAWPATPVGRAATTTAASGQHG